MGIDAECRVDAVVRLGELEHGTAGSEAGADRDHAVHPGLARPCERGIRILERIEVRVGVDHAGVGASMRGKSGGAAAIPETGAVRPYATFSQATSVGWPSAARIRVAVSGR